MNFNNPFGDNYPFIGPPGNKPTDTKYVYDIYVTYYDPDLTYKLPLRLVSVSLNNINIVDAEGTTIYSGPIRLNPWGNDYAVLQATNPANNLSIAVIVSNTLTGTYSPVHGDICLRCVYTQPKHITSFVIDNHKLKGDLIVNYGYNMKYTVDSIQEDELRPMSSVLLDANPGAGLGQTPFTCVQENTSLKTINEVTADENGNIYLFGDPCIKVSQIDTNGISVLDECIPCCECKDFTRAANVLDGVIGDYYEYGAKAESIRDCAMDLKDLLTCGSTIFMRASDLCPVRAYLDTTWPRHAGFTAEFRNVFPAIVTNLKVKVTVVGSPLIKHQALRTMYMEELACDDAYKDTQDTDNFKRLYKASGWSFAGNLPQDDYVPVNEWLIDWTDRELSPGATVWSTVAARNLGIDTKTGKIRTSLADAWQDSLDEPVTLLVEAQYDTIPINCNNVDDIMDCLKDKTINNKDMMTGTIKGGSSYHDNTLNIDIGAKDRVKKICMDLHGGRWH